MNQERTFTSRELCGGFLDQGTPTHPNIMMMLHKLMETVCPESIPDSVAIHISLAEADRWSHTWEVLEYLNGSYWCTREIEDGSSRNTAFGLPTKLYGHDLYIGPKIADGTIQVRMGGETITVTDTYLQDPRQTVEPRRIMDSPDVPFPFHDLAMVIVTLLVCAGIIAGGIWTIAAFTSWADSLPYLDNGKIDLKRVFTE